MAYLDDRFWCHPKLAGLSHRAFRAYVNSITYSSGMNTRGMLTSAQVALVCPQDGPQDSPREVLRTKCVESMKRELFDSLLWDELTNGSIKVHDWDDHNSKRDERKEKDRLRKREERAMSAGQSVDRRAVKERRNEGPKDGTAPRDDSQSESARIEDERATPRRRPLPILPPVDELGGWGWRDEV